jgi:hypothetical protein
MASKRKTREQKRAKRDRQEKRRLKKAAFIKGLLKRSYRTPEPKPSWPECTFEEILAEEQRIEENRRSILFRTF